MPGIQITRGTSAESLRQALQSFGLLSTVEFTRNENSPGVVVLHEVGLGERIRRFLFQSSDERKQQVRQSRAVLQELVRQRPDINALLGKSIKQKQEWTSAEFREALRIPVSILKPARGGGGLQVTLDQPGQVGVANAKVSEIAADCKVVWKLSFLAHNSKAQRSEPNDKRRHAEVSVWRTDAPGQDELRSAYQAVLAKAIGHVVIAPIDDIPYQQRAVLTEKDLSDFLCSRRG